MTKGDAASEIETPKLWAQAHETEQTAGEQGAGGQVESLSGLSFQPVPLPGGGEGEIDDGRSSLRGTGGDHEDGADIGSAPQPAQVDTRPANGDGRPGTASHYGASYEGQPLGCGLRGPVGESSLGQLRDGLYHSADPTIAAVRDGAGIACGQRLRMCAPSTPRNGDGDNRWEGGADRGGGSWGEVQAVQCIVVVRRDSCPGCRAGAVLDIDLSEAGFTAVCGELSIGRCEVLIWAE